MFKCSPDPNILVKLSCANLASQGKSVFGFLGTILHGCVIDFWVFGTKVAIGKVDPGGILIQIFGGNFDDVIGTNVLLNRLKIFSDIKRKFYFINLFQLSAFGFLGNFI